jgi:hypothetical protein
LAHDLMVAELGSQDAPLRGRGPIEQKNGTNEIESDGKDAFVVYNSVRIAKRGQPNSPEAGTWVSLEPGFRVSYKGYPAELVIERDGKIIKTVW